MVPRLREEFVSKGGQLEDFDEELAISKLCAFLNRNLQFLDQIAISENASLDEIAQDIADSLEEAIYLEKCRPEILLTCSWKKKGFHGV